MIRGDSNAIHAQRYQSGMGDMGSQQASRLYCAWPRVMYET